MTYHPDKHNRRSIRLPGYDYSRNGGYFITICTQNRECLFGEIADGVMQLNDAGRTVSEEWTKTAAIREIQLDEGVVMPNHFHGILVIANARRGTACPYDGTIRMPGSRVDSNGHTIIQIGCYQTHQQNAPITGGTSMAAQLL
jgi:hypothetical protein